MKGGKNARTNHELGEAGGREDTAMGVAEEEKLSAPAAAPVLGLAL